MIYIYGLIDPRTDRVRYIGKSIRPMERLANHCNEQSRTWRTNWLRQLSAKGLRPSLVILQELPSGADWQTVERQWIADGKTLGWPLTNCTSGGDGVPDLPQDVRDRMSRTWLGRKHKKSSLKKIGLASRGRKHTPEYCAYMRRIMRGRKITWVNKVSQGLCKLTAEQVSKVKTLLRQGVPQRRIARRFGVHQGTICNINKGRGYLWLRKPSGVHRSQPS